MEQPDTSVLWPHRTLDEHRARPFALPRRLTRESADEAERKKNRERLEKNRERLTALWRLSRSHGISWDELDDAYVRFAKAGKQRYDDWARRGPNGIAAVAEKEEAQMQAVRFIRRFCPKTVNPELSYPSHVRRLTARIYRDAKRKWFAPWRPGRLTVQLQQLVAARMLRRETEERALGFQTDRTDRAERPRGQELRRPGR